MKQLIASLILLAIVDPGLTYAQLSPVQLTVQKISKKKSEGETATEIGNNTLRITAGRYAAAEYLKITVQNTSSKPVMGLVLRWGIVKAQMSGLVAHGSEAIGAEETMDLRPQETKMVETPVVEAGGYKFNDGSGGGSTIRGHGVQLYLDGKVITEEFVPGSWDIKKAITDMKVQPAAAPVQPPAAAVQAPAPVAQRPAAGQSAFDSPEVKEAKQALLDAQKKLNALMQSGQPADSPELAQAKEQMSEALNKFRTLIQEATAKQKQGQR